MSSLSLPPQTPFPINSNKPKTLTNTSSPLSNKVSLVPLAISSNGKLSQQRTNLLSGNNLLKSYMERSEFGNARKLFDEMSVRSLATWSIMIAGFARKGLFHEAVSLFGEMALHDVNPDWVLFSNLIRNCLAMYRLSLGLQLHSQVIKHGYVSNVEMDLIGLYVKNGCLDSANKLFDQMPVRTVAAWTALMVGLTEAGKYLEALALFLKMTQQDTELDPFVFSVVLKACSCLKDCCTARQVHGLIVKLGFDSDVSAGTPIVDFYVKLGMLEDAKNAFCKISEPNDFSWSAILTGYSQLGRFEDCLKIFKHHKSKGTIFNSFVYTTLFQASSGLADPISGCQFHADALKSGLLSKLSGNSALITMYSRCGNWTYARKAFEQIPKPDVIAWTAIITGYAYHGKVSHAIEMFDKMIALGIIPNSISFVGVLTACSHAGLVTEARNYFNLMEKFYGINPELIHYHCLIDAYCRAGLLNDAKELIESGKFEPDGMCWKNLLGGSIIHGNLQFGTIAGENFLKLEPNNSAGYILLFNLYSKLGLLEEAALVRKQMNERDLKKEIGYSWIMVKGRVHRFVAGQRDHPQAREIYAKLDELERFITGLKKKVVIEEETEDLRKQQTFDHSERLAVSLGLMEVPCGCPILIFKNLRICEHCHSFLKSVSRNEDREIIVRDCTRFHHFRDGLCSCNDFW
ncbi:Pentatricopeptide repeat-containing protein [Rhynchospora pubera]|uniref:Pentatricopeptide repeat-containing protein n=1 Tax=Rhynchospora pubera TaxID=906938 RepID=A0AAV8C8X5_9POAL|nr:Pentatricopeptide repeat-containing protein [Rhynchospora pubera]